MGNICWDNCQMKQFYSICLTQISCCSLHAVFCNLFSYVALIDRLSSEDAGTLTTILQPMTTRQLYQLVAATGNLKCRGLNEFCPYLSRQVEFATSLFTAPPPSPSTIIPFSPSQSCKTWETKSSVEASSSSVFDLKQFGSFGTLTALRAILGPLSLAEVSSRRSNQKIFLSQQIIH